MKEQIHVIDKRKVSNEELKFLNRIRKIEKLEVYRHRSRHGIAMWKCYLFDSGGIRCLFLILFRKNRVLTIKKGKKFGGIKNIAYFCG